ncbi:DUF3718 domain-containing protein [Colwellia piezophila]|uniref:DUF3718 domain-containing protein n=1 Tax=Colwellia piezophila TaxID=211668 RepID=UPI0003A8017A|nr:DUF3718 domain-containing protein [Colwellia piezophila]
MMNVLKFILLIVIASFAFNANSIQYKFIAGDNSFATKVCIFAGSDNKKALRRSKQYSIDNVRLIANSVLCNDMPIASFAKKYHAMNTFQYLNRVTKRSLREYETNVEIKDITTAEADTSDVVQIIYVRSAK